MKNNKKQIMSRLRFVTKDGSLINNSNFDLSHFKSVHSGAVEHDLLLNVIGRYAKEKGVHVISYTVSENGVEAVVEYLR